MTAARQTVSSKALYDAARCCIPSFAFTTHKGQHGKIAVIGGSAEYTGAPYYSATSSLKTGGDLGFIFCTPDAATAIKSYDPELIVLPLLKFPPNGDSDKYIEEYLTPWIRRMDVVVVGPGLGRDNTIMNGVQRLIEEIQKLDIPMVLDADALYLLGMTPDILKTSRAILTPNKVEMKRLLTAKNICTNEDDEFDSASQLSASFGGVTILQKGNIDLIAASDSVSKVLVRGSPRRCGGQGDILSGAIATFLAWLRRQKSHNEASMTQQDIMSAAWAGSALTRMAARLAFGEHRRATTTPLILSKLGEAFEATFPNSTGYFPSEIDAFLDPTQAWISDDTGTT